MKRLLIDILIIGALLWIHPLVGLVCALVYAMTLETSYYELLFFGVLVDMIFHTFIRMGKIDIPLYTLITLVIFLILGRIKKSINIYV
jgi:hypothetical protein